ncbi:alkaline phosphatase D family protein [Croceivirga thetidis]|uniref:Alkaline phosphatase family protein n=1 Tax=Croceivirga thetidis TaxID=2721623 RepID=A0ABX1GUU7_9FLAO|nr:alkaline phosphatase D family protein [Croceivirga thetidis]NKI32831.1 alkaline phosphatase family protein [Croceivirga thetidis]
MKKSQIFRTLLLVIIGLSAACSINRNASKQDKAQKANTTSEVIRIAFGSCNKTDSENKLWDDILANEPVMWIWGGDNIYADTDDVEKLRAMYLAQNQIEGYRKLKENTMVTGVWDDHDYGLNDGGEEFAAKNESQQEFLDFMGISKNDSRREINGIYSKAEISTPTGLVNIYNLDTRYFRSKLKKSTERNRRYEPDTTSSKTLLGKTQWAWLEEELTNSRAEFNLIISSIQFLSSEHGYEKWANFPHEVEKMKEIIVKSGAKGVLFLSGDRHISEFSKTSIKGLNYPIIDFTSSGLTHSYTEYSGEPNKYRVGKVVNTVSFGIIELDLTAKEVTMKILTDGNVLLQELKQSY